MPEEASKSGNAASNDKAANKNDSQVNQNVPPPKSDKGTLFTFTIPASLLEGGFVCLIFWLYCELFSQSKPSLSHFFWVFAVSAACAATAITVHKHWPHKIVLAILVIAACAVNAFVAYRYGDSESPENSTRAEKSTTPNAPAATSDPGTTNAPFRTLPDGRIVINKDPKFLHDLINDHTGIEAKQILEPYVGKWMEVTGNISHLDNDPTSDGFELGINLPAIGDGIVSMSFKKNWGDRLRLFKIGDQVIVLGQIHDVTDLWVNLNNCELK